MPRYICRATSYCLLNKTKMTQTGRGYQVQCPICKHTYTPLDKPPTKLSDSDKQRIIDSTVV